MLGPRSRYSLATYGTPPRRSAFSSHLTPGETARLLDLLDREAIVARARGHRLPVRDAMLIRLAIISSLLASELCALTIADLAVVHGQPTRVQVRNGKGGKARDVPLPTSLRKPLKEYLAWMRNAGYETDGDAPLLPGRTAFSCDPGLQAADSGR